MTGPVLAMLKLLETDKIICFEWTLNDHGSQPSEEDRLIRHPFPVLDLEDGSYLLLHDTDRFKSLVESGIDHVPAQICSRKSLRIGNPRLSLVNYTYGDLEQYAEEHTGMVLLEEPDASAPRAEYLHVMFEFPRRGSVIVHFHNENRIGCPDSVDMLFRRILKKGTYLADWGHAHYADTVVRSQTFSGHVTLPPFDLNALERAAINDRLFPPNVITIQTDRRVFNIDFPLSVLRADISIEEKQQFLRDMVLIREQSSRTTFFEGQVYILNR